MMNKLHVDDLSIGELSQAKYDIALFSCGYEERCIDVATRLKNHNIENVIVLAFDQHQEDPVRVESLNYFSEKWSNFQLLEISQREISSIQKKLSEIIFSLHRNDIKILIDYTSMSRAWYAAILNYLVNFCELKVTIDLTYATAVYKNLDLNVELGELRIIPGCEGISLTKRHNAAIFMLGFDRYGPQRLYNLLNPNKCFGIMAAPAATYDYENTCLEKNKDFISHYLGGEDKLIKLPINSIATCYDNMSQMLSPLRSEYNVSIIPFGPKPHILTAILCSFNYPNVTCLYSEYIRKETTKVQSSGDFVISRLYIQRS
ncbi:hypothetical protein ACSVJV_003422 [Vibrio cholerae]|uniref:hypothetical protein n=5 Tax=Vibrio cholerae TaxID=666 RepID=UPI001F07C58B|nr:hypothetical protein [Vibrio cholerae]UWY94953.1 hypothetical protein N4267_18650 [Vibrio cholerae]UWY98514.1 hypothetical protein N4269_18645 [Vibrio cholerae]GHW68729.1 hypothetical protein VCSRO58_2456 [Vibrio cholerae]